LGALLETGASIAIVSDAGTPGINDPGFRLVRECIARGAQVVPLPGPTALIAALVASGLPTDEFYFGGFLPARTQARRARFEDVRALSSTLIFYEAPHRIAQSLVDAREILGEREAAVARELTKLHEEIMRGRLSDLVKRFGDEAATARGEMVLLIDRAVIAGEEASMVTDTDLASRVAALESEGLEPRAALKKVARELGLNRAEAYRRLTSSRARQKS
jgi:16S rRNA (cytidine1402-2'-O)-methyltransferase